MLPIVFINCDLFPFVEWIISGKKIYETRNRNTLKRFIGQVIMLAETHKGKKPVVRCMAYIDRMERVNAKQFDSMRKDTMIETGSAYDLIDDNKTKCLYKLSYVYPVPAFIPPEDTRHGYVWMEYNHNIRDSNYKQWIADCYHCSDIWGQKQTDMEMYIELMETQLQKFPDDYSPSPYLFRECAAYWNKLSIAYPN